MKGFLLYNKNGVKLENRLLNSNQITYLKKNSFTILYSNCRINIK